MVVADGQWPPLRNIGNFKIGVVVFNESRVAGRRGRRPLQVCAIFKMGALILNLFRMSDGWWPPLRDNGNFKKGSFFLCRGGVFPPVCPLEIAIVAGGGTPPLRVSMIF